MSQRNDQINDEEILNLLDTYYKLRNEKNSGPSAERKYKEHQNLCVKKLQYLVSMRTFRYKNFSNYEDLNQDGILALISAINTYNPKKGNFFWWAHKYIDTKISRQANKHITIKVPLKKAKKLRPMKVDLQSLNSYQEANFIDNSIADLENKKEINYALQSLSEQKRNIIKLFFGLDGDKPHSLDKISKKLNLSKDSVSVGLREAKEELKHKITI